MEMAGHLDQAKGKLAETLTLVADHPSARDQIKRLDEAMDLQKAVAHRSRRIRETNEDRRGTPAPPARKSPLAISAMLIAAITTLLLALGYWKNRQPAADAKPAAGMPPAAVERTGPMPTLPAPADESTQSSPTPAEMPRNPDQAIPAAAIEAADRPAAAGPAPPLPHSASAATRVTENGDPAVVLQAAPSSPSDPAPPTAATIEAEGQDTYLVQTGDSLSNIAYRLFCNQNEWETLYALNRDILVDAKKLEVGTRLRLRQGHLAPKNLCR
jgi:nucleoid-associated protein YgaU